MTRRREWVTAVKAEPFPASLRSLKATLLCLANLMTPEGELHRWRPELLDAAQVPDRTLDWHLRKATELGWLWREVRGGHGRRGKYLAVMPGESCPQLAADNLGELSATHGGRRTRVVRHALVDNSPELSATVGGVSKYSASNSPAFRS